MRNFSGPTLGVGVPGAVASVALQFQMDGEPVILSEQEVVVFELFEKGLHGWNGELMGLIGILKQLLTTTDLDR